MIVRTDHNEVFWGIRTEDVFQASFIYENYADSADVGPFSGKVALRYDETSSRAAENGVLIGNEDAIDDIVGQPPFRTRLALRAEANAATGNGSGVAFHIKTLKYFPRKVSDQELQNLTGGVGSLVPANTITLRDGSYLQDRAGNYIETRA